MSYSVDRGNEQTVFRQQKQDVVTIVVTDASPAPQTGLIRVRFTLPRLPELQHQQLPDQLRHFQGLFVLTFRHRVFIASRQHQYTPLPIVRPAGMK